jgi:tRNA G10  N-methylase Trm11
LESPQMSFLYTFACHEDERALCELEMRSLFQEQQYSNYVRSKRCIDPSRSPFIKYRLDISLSSESLEDLVQQVKGLDALDSVTFKVSFIECGEYLTYEEQRDAERKVGLHIRGKADMRAPDKLFGVARLGDEWVFGACTASEAIWLKHVKKPQNYSTALSARVARAIVNIAVSEPAGTAVIDPCCGMGTVLIEAMSMGIHIVGSDVNPLAVRGARRNLNHYGLNGNVSIADIKDVPGSYDVVILDMPYNICSVSNEEEQLQLLSHAARLAVKAVIITTEAVDSLITAAGYIIVDRCIVRKGSFARHVIVAEHSN